MGKITGLSFGRKNSNSEAFLKAALMAAEEDGMETEIIRSMDMKILPCTSCGACFGNETCPHDDTDWLFENIMLGESALIVAAPVYHLRAPGSLMCASEKINHFFMRNPIVHERRKLCGAISVGGSGYDGWTSLGLPTIHLLIQHFSTLVDQIQIDHCADRGAALTPDNEWAIERSRQLGHNLVKAMALPFEEVKYVGDDSPISCPVCHCDVFYLDKGLPDIMCPTCQVHGKVSSKEGKYQVEWNADDIREPRFSAPKQHHHMEWIMRHRTEEGPQLEMPEVQEKIKQYNDWGRYLKPAKKGASK